mmetsp:Transcript_3969/g.9524  ORF Transcript_3969/g.9524 Transcript_3969/m.9524 type:complete len:301 (-) Transcript_3969:70-972(-)
MRRSCLAMAARSSAFTSAPHLSANASAAVRSASVHGVVPSAALASHHVVAASAFCRSVFVSSSSALNAHSVLSYTPTSAVNASAHSPAGNIGACRLWCAAIAALVSGTPPTSSRPVLTTRFSVAAVAPTSSIAAAARFSTARSDALTAASRCACAATNGSSSPRTATAAAATMPYATIYFGIANTGEITTNLTLAEDISEQMAKMIDCPLKQTSFSRAKGTWFTTKWWMASNVRNYAVVQGVMDVLAECGYELKSADKDYIVMYKPEDYAANNDDGDDGDGKKVKSAKSGGKGGGAKAAK